MELDPKYVDVIVTRWHGFTGRQAILESGDSTFTNSIACSDSFVPGPEKRVATQELVDALEP